MVHTLGLSRQNLFSIMATKWESSTSAEHFQKVMMSYYNLSLPLKWFPYQQCTVEILSSLKVCEELHCESPSLFCMWRHRCAFLWAFLSPSLQVPAPFSAHGNSLIATTQLCNSWAHFFSCWVVELCNISLFVYLSMCKYEKEAEVGRKGSFHGQLIYFGAPAYFIWSIWIPTRWDADLTGVLSCWYEENSLSPPSPNLCCALTNVAHCTDQFRCCSWLNWTCKKIQNCFLKGWICVLFTKISNCEIFANSKLSSFYIIHKTLNKLLAKPFFWLERKASFCTCTSGLLPHSPCSNNNEISNILWRYFGMR